MQHGPGNVGRGIRRHQLDKARLGGHEVFLVMPERIVGIEGNGGQFRHYVSASRSFLLSRSVSLLSWPQAAKMSRPRGVRTGLA